jgi:hypothetical protein
MGTLLSTLTILSSITVANTVRLANGRTAQFHFERAGTPRRRIKQNDPV